MILMYVTMITIFFGIEGVVFIFSIPSALNVFIQGVTTFFFHKDGVPRYVNWLNWFVFGDGNHDEHHKNVKKYKLKNYDISGWMIDKILKRE